MSNDQPSKTEQQASAFDTTVTHAELDPSKAAAQREVFGFPVACLSIIVVEFCERLAYYGATLCFTLYMMNMLKFSTESVNGIVNGFSAWCYLCSICGGYLGDSVLGKTKSILVFASIYLVGFIVLTLSASPLAFGNFPLDPSPTFVYGGFFFALFLIGTGTGGIKSLVSVFVADQITDKKQVDRVFSYFYWAINAGAMIGQFVTPFLHHFGTPMKDLAGVEQGTSFWLAFLFPTFALIVGIMIFVKGIPTYTNTPVGDSLFTKSISVVVKAIKNRKLGASGTPFLNRALCTDSRPETAQLVEDLKAVGSAVKVFVFFPIYWLLYNQMQTTFIQQATMMRSPSWMTPDQLNIINPLSIIIMIPVLDTLVFPTLRKWGFNMGPLPRITCGFVMSSLSLLYASGMQYIINSNGNYVNGQYVLNVPVDQQLSIAYQIPAFIFIGISEIFASVTSLELAYSQAPESMKGIVMSLYLLTVAAGSLLGVAFSPYMSISNLFGTFTVLGGAMVFLSIAFFFTFRNTLQGGKETTQG